MAKFYIFFAVTLIVFTISAHVEGLSKLDPNPICIHYLSQNVINEIRSYQPLADEIVNLVVNGEFKGKTYKDLAVFVDTFPNRLTGGKGLEDSIDHVKVKMERDGMDKIWAETAEVTHWTRGEEKAEILQPIQKKLRVLGLAPTEATPDEGITAQAIVVYNYTDLEQKRELVPGKIVVYNSGWLGSYGETVMYRSGGAVRAGEFGAVAALAESVAPMSLDTPHTGGTNFSPNVTRIPFASITREDAEMLSRIQERGENITIKLLLKDTLHPKTTSRNLIGEIVGRETPDEKVAVSAHIDAWDAGQGAQDDGGGVLLCVEALAVIKKLGLRPRRSLQAIFWTAEEQGLEGVQQFVNQHRADMIKYNVVFESDSGTFRPRGLDFAGTEEAGCIIQEVLKLLSGINATEFASYPTVGSDISFMISEGVPGLSLMNENENYFRYHHSPADTMSAENSEDLDLGLALWAITSYVLADLSTPLPRENSVKP